MKNFTPVLALVASFVMLSAGCACDSLSPGQAQPLRSSSSQIAGPSWNTLNAAYNFDSYPQSPNTTFAQAYNGSDFNADFAAILHDIAAALGTTIPPYTSSGKLVDLDYWPDS